MRRVQSRYAQYYNAHNRRNRRNGTPLAKPLFRLHAGPGPSLWAAIAHVERNPLRAKIVRRAEDYRWSSAVAHVTGGDGPQLLDMEWWRRAGRRDWREILNRALRQAVYRGKDNRPAACMHVCGTSIWR